MSWMHIPSLTFTTDSAITADCAYAVVLLPCNKGEKSLSHTALKLLDPYHAFIANFPEKHPITSQVDARASLLQLPWTHHQALETLQQPPLLWVLTVDKGPEAMRTKANLLWQHLKKVKAHAITLFAEALGTEDAKTFLEAFTLCGYTFSRYLTRLSPLEREGLEKITVYHHDADILSRWWTHTQPIVEGTYLARNLVNEPASVVTPSFLKDQALALQDKGVTVTVLDRLALEDKGFGALLGVAKGSIEPPFVVTLHFEGKKDAPLTALVGKGVTFDSGGLSLKPADAMEDMKGDMAGAAAILGAIHALASQQAPVNVVAVLALVENMPSSHAQRPGDVVHSLSGQTIEVLNTDAEGRLILADALWYTQEMFAPTRIIDLATLTGAVRIALGGAFAGLCSNDDSLADALQEAGTRVGEMVWRLPLHKSYDKALTSTIADMKNIAHRGTGAGSSVGAQFLARFIKKGMKWAHLDIAGVSGDAKPTLLCGAPGATGFGVRLLVETLTQKAL